MYTPAPFALSEDEAWRVLERAGALTLVARGAAGLTSVLVPVLLERPRALLAHVARANRFWRDVGDGAEVMGLATVASGYVSPRDYPTTRENPAAVPTWNYVAAEVHGTLRVHQERDWLRDVTWRLTERFEEGRAEPWRVEEAPAQYVERLLGAVVGLEIEVSRVEGKAKYSQNRPVEDVAGMRRALAEGSLAQRALAEEVGRWD